MNKLNTISYKLLTIEDKKILIQTGWITFFAILTAIGAQIEIPHHPVPFTLQTFFVLLAGAILGKRNGAISMGLYIVMGAAGLPVFSGWGYGIARIIGPTGGYLLSFPVAAFAIGYLLQQRSNIYWYLTSMFVGLFVIFSFGTIYLNFVYFHDWYKSITNGFLIFSWWDGVKMFAAAAIAKQINRRS